MTKYGVAIIGAGIGAEHLAAYRGLPARFRVQTVCDLDQARAQRVLGGSPGTTYSSDLAEVLADEAVDIVDICLPPHLHLDACISALEAGKQVICEKPLVTSLADLDRLEAISVRTGRRIFPVYQYRYGDGTAQLHALIESGLAGRAFVASLETHWNRDSTYYAVDWRGTWAGEQGGAILGHSIHIHDWLSAILGPVASVYAELGTRVNSIEVEDCAALSIRMANGALVTSSVTLGAAWDTSRLRFCFEGLTAESGSLPYRPAEGDWTFTARLPGNQADVDRIVSGAAGQLSSYAGLFDAIADALDGAPGREVTLEDARRSLEFVSAVYASSRRGEPMALPLAQDDPIRGGWCP